MFLWEYIIKLLVFESCNNKKAESKLVATGKHNGEIANYIKILFTGCEKKNILKSIRLLKKSFHPITNCLITKIH